MNPVDIGIQRMNDRLALPAHEPATWIWLGVSIAAVVVYVVAFLGLTQPYDSIGEWLGLAAFGGVAWILLGWMVEIMTLDVRGHFTFVLGWEYPVMFAFPVAVGIASRDRLGK